ncbi:MAG: cystathionine gamma-synthase family protein [Burkholderiaceae bacterium]
MSSSTQNSPPEQPGFRPESLMMSYGYKPALSEGAIKPPVFLTSSFTFPSAQAGAEFFDRMSGRKPGAPGENQGLIYSRFNHPNMEIAEDRLALLEQADSAAVFASGMAAISAIFMTFLRPGNVLLYCTPLYGGTETLIRNVLPQWGVRPLEVACEDLAAQLPDALAAARDMGRLAMVYLESPANPTNVQVDFDFVRKEVAQATPAGERPALIVCDNTLLGPVFSSPLRFGVDLCAYSLTKYVGGHSDLVAGSVVGPSALVQQVRQTRSAFGSQLDPHTCWMICRSLETLTIRMQRAASSGSRVAAWLAGNPYAPVQLYHPEHMQGEQKRLYEKQCIGPGSTFSFVVPGGRAQAFAIIDGLRLVKSAVSLGGTESLVCHPASTTHSGVPQARREAAGVVEGLIRLSVGLEHPDDLISDLDQAFAKVFMLGDTHSPSP